MDSSSNKEQNCERCDKEKKESEMNSSSNFPKLEFKKVLHKITHNPAELALNTEKSLLLAGNEFLRFYSFTNKLKLVYKLQVTTSLKSQYISHIQFMKKRPEFITKVHHTFDYTSICIWGQSNETSWKIQTAIEIGSIIPQIILSNDENTLIILNEYENISIFSKQQNWKNINTIRLKKSVLNQISLSPSETMLLCVSWENIFVIEKESSKIGEWVVKQKISLQSSVSSAYFYSNKSFICKLSNETFIRIYELDIIDNEYKSIQQSNVLLNFNLKEIQLSSHKQGLVFIQENNIINLDVIENNFQLVNLSISNTEYQLAFFNENSNFSTERSNCLLYIRLQ